MLASYNYRLKIIHDHYQCGPASDIHCVVTGGLDILLFPKLLMNLRKSSPMPHRMQFTKFDHLFSLCDIPIVNFIIHHITVKMDMAL